MADLSISGKMKVKTLKANFKEEITMIKNNKWYLFIGIYTISLYWF